MPKWLFERRARSLCPAPDSSSPCARVILAGILYFFCCSIARDTIYRTYGLLYVYAKENDSFDQIAQNLDFPVKDLKKFNEVPEDFPLQKGDIVYIEKKKKKADKPNYDHVVQVGESMHSIAQKYGIQIKSLYKMNKKDKDYVPEEGDVLKLR